MWQKAIKMVVDNKYAILALFSAMLLRSITGLGYIFGNLLPYIASYMASKNGNTTADYEYYTEQCSWLYTAYNIQNAFFILVGAKLEQRIGLRKTAVAGLIIMNIGVLLSYFTCNSFWGMLITYGILTGIGAQMVFPTTILCAMSWFPNHKGIINGIVSFCTGVTGIVFNPVSTLLINPNNKAMDSNDGFLNQHDVLMNLQSYFWKIGLIYSSLSIIGVIFLKYPEAYDENNSSNTDEISMQKLTLTDVLDEHNNSLNAKRDDKSAADDENEKTTLLNDSTDHKVVPFKLCSWLFVNLWMTFLCNILVAPYINSQWKEFNNVHLGITDDYLLSLMGTSANVCNSISRIFWPTLYDYFKSYITTTSIIFIGSTILLLTWPFLNDINVINVEVLGFIWLSGLYFFKAGIFTVFTTHIATVWGIRQTGVIYGYLAIGNIFGQITSMIIITEIKNKLGWIFLNYIFAAVNAVALVFVWTSKITL
eukprot:342224_1